MTRGRTVSHDFLYEGAPDVPVGMTLAEYGRARDARIRSRNAAVELCAAIESRDPFGIRRAEREYTLALLELACELS
jgi:hypothetical protein